MGEKRANFFYRRGGISLRSCGFAYVEEDGPELATSRPRMGILVWIVAAGLVDSSRRMMFLPWPVGAEA